MMNDHFYYNYRDVVMIKFLTIVFTLIYILYTQ